MEFNFDKEIDALLRQTAKSETVSVAEDLKSNHLDADEISAFAENALPENAKQRFTMHLANCDSCRKKLSNVITLNAESENETVPANEIKIVSPAIPWYKRLFAYPNLAYTLGALVIIFSGIIGFTVLQNINNAGKSEVSQIGEKTQNVREMPAVKAPEAENLSSSANMSANTNSSTALLSNAAAANTSASSAADSTANAVSKPVPAPPKPVNEPAVEEKSPAVKSSENSFVMDGAGNAASAAPNEKQDDKAEKDKKEPQSKEDKEAADSTAITERQQSELPKGTTFNSMLRTARKTTQAAGEIKSVGDKTFRRANDVWYDTNYNNQTTTNISRGSKEYKNLDKNLRLIADTLNGTIIVIWKEKAYRIQ